MAQTDLAKNYLGSGYDICGKYADGVSVKRKIFDLTKVPKESIRELSNREAQFFSVSGKTVEEYQSKLGIKAGVSGSYGLFSGSVEASFSSTDLSISESSYVSINLCMRYKTCKLQVTSKDYMFPDVVEKFKTKDGRWLIEQYGAGVVMGFDIGGRWSDNLAVSKLFNNSTSDVAVSMEAAYGSFISGNGSVEVSNAVKNNNSIATRRVTVVGGNPAFAPGKLEDWQKSVEGAPALMNFTRDGLVMIWDLFPEYSTKLREGFKQHLDQHKVNVSPVNLIQGMRIEGHQYATYPGTPEPELRLYKPELSGDYKYVGVSGDNNKVIVVRTVSDNYGALREPESWQQIWTDKGSGNKEKYSCWLPKAPAGFAALGIYCRFGVNNYNPPSKEETKGFVVVHQSLVEECSLDYGYIWGNYTPSPQVHQIILGQLPTEALWPSRTTDPAAGQLPTTYKLKDEFIAAAKKKK